MKLKLLIIVYFSLNVLFILRAQSPDQGGIIEFSGDNFRIYPSNVNQTEVFIKRSPVNPDILFSSCNTLNFIPFFVSEGIYTSIDGGITWQGSDTCGGEPIAYHGGDPGIVIDNAGRFMITRLGRTPFVGLYSHYSTDNGQTWSAQQVISTDDLERATLTSDAIEESAYYGRTYAAWVKFALPFPLMFSYTDDGGQSWTTPIAVNNPTTRSAGGDLAIGPNGEVYACWAGVTDVSPFKEIQVGFASSPDGGENWSVVENAFPMNGITGVLANKDNIRVNGLPSIAVDTTSGPHRGWIYIITGEKDLAPAGSDPDIVLHRSVDGGITWSEGIRVNQDAFNTGKTQYFPSIHIDRFGALNVLYYDDRNTSTDSTGVFLARSKDGGDTWQDFEVSDHNFKPTPIGGLGQGYQGDNIDITSTNTSLLPVWMDNSTGVYQVWSTRINFSEVNAIDEKGKLNRFFVSKIFPNPFSESTTIQYQISEKGMVLFQIYDIHGNLIAEPVREEQSPGMYDLQLRSMDLFGKQSRLNGIFLFRISHNGYSETERLILMD
jgi:hypothetical protein